jgi:hypothetical protein
MKMEKVETAQRNLEGKPVMKTEFRTEDEGPQSISAGKLTPEGVTFRFCFLKTHEGSYVDKQTGELRPFYTAEGVGLDGRSVTLMFGSKRLFKVLEKVKLAYVDTREVGMGATINIAGIGEGFDRNYKVVLAE